VNKEQTKLEDRETIRTLISSSAKFLDEGNYAQFTELFLENGRYLLVARSDEIGRDMTWLDMSRDELVALLEESHQHVHDLAKRMHIVSVDQFCLMDWIIVLRFSLHLQYSALILLVILRYMLLVVTAIAWSGTVKIGELKSGVSMCKPGCSGRQPQLHSRL